MKIPSLPSISAPIVLVLVLSSFALLSAASAQAPAVPASPVMMAPSSSPVMMAPSSSPFAAAPGSTAEISISFKLAKPYHVYAPGEKEGVNLSFSVPPEFGRAEADLPAPVVKKMSPVGDEMIVFESDFDAKVRFRVPETAAAGALTVPVSVRYQACTDDSCTPPALGTVEIRLAVAGTAAPPPATASRPNEATKTSFMAVYEKGFLWAVLIAFLWGVMSSLTPCVYPMIPITVAFFGSQAPGGSKLKSLSLALVFVAGIALSFSVLGVAVTLVGVDIGSVMANPWIMGAVCLMFVFFAGAMFELYEIKAPAALTGKLGQSEGGYFGALAMGLTMGLVAAPCVGPFAGALLIFVSMIRSVPVGFVMLFSYGAGLGMLFLFVAMGAKFLPRSGMWMVRLKNFFGLLLLWINVYFLQFVMPVPALLAVSSLFSIATAAVLGVFSTVDENSPLPLHFAKGAGVVALAAASLFAIGAILEAGFILIPAPAARPGVSDSLASAGGEKSEGWTADYEAGMARALAEKKPVIVDFYADWCIPCKRMASDVFASPEFMEATKDFVRIKLDCTDSSSKGAAVKRDVYKSVFMPYIVFHGRDGSHLKSLDVDGYTGLAEIKKIVSGIR